MIVNQKMKTMQAFREKRVKSKIFKYYDQRRCKHRTVGD